MKSENISEFLQTRIGAKDFPSAVYLVAERGSVIFQDALGCAVVEPEKIEAKIDTIYDLASLTKPLVTGLLGAKLIERGEINLEDKISKFFAEFDTDEKREITIVNLLTHTSGFPAWRPFYLIQGSRCEIQNSIASEPLENLPKARVVYSDFNFLLLGFLLEKLYGESLDRIAQNEIFAPLKLENTFFNPPKKLQKRIAASENGNEYEKQMCVELGFEFRIPNSEFRTQIVWGEVHDGNSYFMNGVAGHAGLFSDAFGVFKIAQQFLAEETVLLKPETCKLFRANYTKGLNEARSMAFQLAATKDSTASEALAKDSFGHLGFTGTSLWIEPETERICILLTNRTHARELPFANINAVRRRFHELASSDLKMRD
ncbi:MAG: serine hydrolase domain-containing protein [Pyrinomonadaceae bacterium]